MIASEMYGSARGGERLASAVDFSARWCRARACVIANVDEGVGEMGPRKADGADGHLRCPQLIGEALDSTDRT